ncbi:MAG: protein kinase [Minicystis sp.]
MDSRICAALAEAHRRGIVHRDLKPANVFVTHAEDGEPRLKLLDFGIAKMLAAPEGVDPLTTLEGTIMGTPFFMAPEQIAGGAVDPRTDVWALGVLLYDLLTGHLPFQSEAPVTSLAKILAQPPTPPSAYRPTPPDLERIILRCLEKHASARPTSVGEVADALAPFAGARGAPLSRRVHRVLDGASIPNLTPAPIASATPTLAAASHAVIASVAPPPGRAEPSPALSQAPRPVPSEAPRPVPLEAPRPSPSRAASVLVVAAVVLVAAACFALASREAAPHAIPAAEPPPVRAVAPAPTVAAGTHAKPPADAQPPAEIATARPAASTPAPAPRGGRPAAGGPSAGFDWGDRH